MRQIVLLLSLFLITISSNAQKESDFFTSPEFMTDIQEFNKTTKGSNKKRCQLLMKQEKHMNDDGEIQYQYVLHAKDTLNKQHFLETVKKWAKSNYKDYEKSTITETDSIAEYTGYFTNIGQVMSVFNATIINAISYIRIEAKSDRIRITATVRHYSMAQSGVDGVKTALTLPKDVYPYHDSENKSSYAQAYINSHYNLITKVAEIMYYFNKNYPTLSDRKKKDDDW